MRTDLHKPALGLVNPRADIGGETIAYEFYHAINVGAAAGNVFFFQNAGGLAPLLSNWEFGNQSAFSAGNAFSLYGVGFDVVFTPSTVAEDAAAAFGDLTTLNQFARVATFRLRVESKDYLDVPVMRLSAGSGITSQGIAVDVAQILKQPYCEIGEAGARAIELGKQIDTAKNLRTGFALGAAAAGLGSGTLVFLSFTPSRSGGAAQVSVGVAGSLP